MTFLAPVFFYIGLGVAAGAVALHFIVTRQPASSPLPTVRFVPTSSVRVTTVAPVPEDLLVLLVRVLIALLLGAAFARPVLTPDRRPVARVVMADVSRAVGSIAQVRDSARALLGPRDVLVAFDSAARTVRSGAADSAARLTRTEREGRLSPALIAALRAAAAMRDEADSIELAIVSPLRASEVDASTQAIRALWPGRVRVVRVATGADTLPPRAGLAIHGAADDPLAFAAAAAGIATSDSAVRVVRGTASAADSAWAAGGRRTLVRWPAAGAPSGWVARATVDTVGAVIAGEAALVFPLERRWALDTATHPTRVVARWVDGQPAAIDRAVGEGCIRDVAIGLPARGDLVLRPAFGRFVRAIGTPCEGVAGGPALDEARVSALAGSGPLAASGAVRPPDVTATPLVPWLLGAALALVLVELLVRRGSAPLWSGASDDARSARDTGAAA
ncbi:MAG TPA: BatA domain-containing protein [Gemmatimonadaceae bacterium]